LGNPWLDAESLNAGGLPRVTGCSPGEIGPRSLRK
jgi:hypothetical protein